MAVRRCEVSISIRLVLRRHAYIAKAEIGKTMILATSEIRRRLSEGLLFRPGSWVPEGVQEASYDLRVAPDGLFAGGQPYSPGKPYPKDYIQVAPGEIAVFSTLEEPNMPSNVVGRLGVKFDYTVKGITPLFGFQVDPGYGADDENERIFLRVANLGSQPVIIRSGERVFNLEFHLIDGQAEIVKSRREPTWSRLQKQLLPWEEAAWSNIVNVEQRMRKVEQELRDDMSRIERSWQQVVFFGIFLIAASLLGGTIAALINTANNSAPRVPIWFLSWSWALLLILIGVAVIVTLVIGVLAAKLALASHPKPDS